MKARKITSSCAVSMAIMLLSFTQAHAKVGATTPFTEYEAEAGTLAGGATVVTAATPTPAYITPAQEASGRSYVQLAGTGQSVTWTNTTSQNITAFNIRYSVPPTTDGVGATYTLDLYVNGTFRQTVSMNSKQTWLYETSAGTNGQSRTPGTGLYPHIFYDEMHAFITGAAIAPGSTITLKQDSTNTASFYYIDLIDLEAPPAALTQPANSLSVISYGADPTGGTDSTTPIQNCINAAETSGQIVWMPVGTFLVSSKLSPTNVAITGAGEWYTELYRVPVVGSSNRSEILMNGGSIQNIFLDSNGTYRGQPGIDYGINVYGSNWLISNVWVEHTLAGVWACGSNSTIQNCRINNTWADGINLNNGQGSDINNTIQNNFVRGTDDDGISLDPTPPVANSVNILVINNTSECNVGATCMRLGGGMNEIVMNNLLQDNVTENCLLVGVWTNLQSGIVTGNSLVRGGSYINTTKNAAMLIEGGAGSGNSYFNTDMYVGGNTISNCYFSGIDVNQATDLVLANNTIASPGTTGIVIDTSATGNAILTNNTVTNLNAGQLAFFNQNPPGYSVDTTSAVTNSAIAAASYTSASGVGTQPCNEGGLNLDNITTGSYSVYNNINLSGVTNFVARVASNAPITTTNAASIAIHLDSPTGTLIGTCTVPGTGGWQTWTTVNCPVGGATGYHNVYLVYTGSPNVEWWVFQQTNNTIEASGFNSTSGLGTQPCSEGGLNLDNIVTGSYSVYNNVNLNGATVFTARVASGTSGGSIGIYLDSPTGTLIGTCPVTGTGGWQTWTTASCYLNGAAGYHNIYLVFSGGSGYLLNLEWFSFQGAGSGATEAASYNSVSGSTITTQTCSEGGLNLGYILNGNYAVYNNVNLNSITSFAARAASATAVGQTAGTIGVHLDSATGTLLGTLTVLGTGGWQTWATASCNLSGATGYHNLYLVFSGSSGNLFNLESFALNGGIQEGVNAIGSAADNILSGSLIGTQTCSEGGLNLDYIQNGNYAVYNQINLTGMTSLSARVASNTSVGQTAGTIGVHLDSPTGTQVGTMTVLGTGGWQTWATQSCVLSSTATGYHNVYLVFTGGAGNLFNFEWFAWQGNISDIPAASFTSESGGIVSQSCSLGGLNIDETTNGSYAVYNNIDLTGASTFTAEVASAAAGGNIQVYLGGPPGTGTLIGTCAVTGTGGWQTWTSVSCPLSSVPSGPQNVYLVFTGGGGYLMNVAWFYFNNPP